jgi:hypothetical protein
MGISESPSVYCLIAGVELIGSLRDFDRFVGVGAKPEQIVGRLRCGAGGPDAARSQSCPIGRAQAGRMATPVAELVQGGPVPVDRLEIGLRPRHLDEIMDWAVVGAYAKEELVAEMTGAFVCASLGIVPTVRRLYRLLARGPARR